jgi:hypothetical protein
MVTFVFSNPRHHLDMMVPVAKALGQRRVPCRFVSLAELRGFETPDLATRLPAIDVKRALPRIRRDPSVGAELGAGGEGTGATVRKLLQRGLWQLALGPRLRWLLRESELVVVPNDAAFPYAELARQLGGAHVPFALMQEGIRFPLPTEQKAGAPYGGGGATAICAWGDASAAHFRSVGAPPTTIRVTGNPRLDDVDPAAWRERGQALANKLGFTRAPLLYLSNTIDDQGFVTTAEKMQLFERFCREAGPVAARDGRAIAVKLHAREDVAAFKDVAAKLTDVHVLGDEPLFAVLAMGHAAVVLASTVGLEALVFGLPLAVLELPRHGHVFEYVTSGAAIGLRLDAIADGVTQLLAPPSDRAASERDGKAKVFLEHHMANRGRAAARVADCLVELKQRVS